MFYISCSFTLLVCGEKNILPNLTNSQEPEPVRAGCLWLHGAGARAAWKKNQEPEPLGKKIRNQSRSQSRLKKKSGAGADKNLTAPQPCMKHKKIVFFQDKKDARPNLTVKVLKRMHLDMKHGSFADMSFECKRLGGTKKNRHQELNSNTGMYYMYTQRPKFYNR